jgi:hypothetical protein
MTSDPVEAMQTVAREEIEQRIEARAAPYRPTVVSRLNREERVQVYDIMQRAVQKLADEYRAEGWVFTKRQRTYLNDKNGWRDAEEWAIQTRAIHALSRGFIRPGEVKFLSDAYLRGIPGIGQKSLDWIRAKLLVLTPVTALDVKRTETITVNDHLVILIHRSGTSPQDAMQANMDAVAWLDEQRHKKNERQGITLDASIDTQVERLDMQTKMARYAAKLANELPRQGPHRPLEPRRLGGIKARRDARNAEEQQ